MLTSDMPAKSGGRKAPALTLPAALVAEEVEDVEVIVIEEEVDIVAVAGVPGLPLVVLGSSCSITTPP